MPKDDYISHAESMRAAFSKMVNRGYCRSIKDKKIYNCWHYSDAAEGHLVSNPHDMYGYLMNQDTAAVLGGWI